MTDTHTTRPFATVFAVDTVNPDIVKIAVEAVRQGYAVIPIPPGSKRPTYCTLTVREQGDATRKHLCGVHHAITDKAVAKRVFKKAVETYTDRVNIGIVAFPSRIVTIDADTAVGVENFLADWADAENDPAYLLHTPTTRTPGMADRDGVMVHKDGGHWHFTVPEGVTLGLGRQKIVSPRGYDIRWGWSMAIVPPSMRAEGPYESTSAAITEAPAWITAKIIEDTDTWTDRTITKGEMFGNDSIARWSNSVSWGELLLPDGWGETHHLDRCGCPIFERPGATNWKSATGHESVCSQYLNLEKHGPLHLWTDAPPPPLDAWVEAHGKTMTKLQYVAATRFDGDTDLAKIELGIGVDPAEAEAMFGGQSTSNPASGGIASDEPILNPSPKEKPGIGLVEDNPEDADEGEQSSDGDGWSWIASHPFFTDEEPEAVRKKIIGEAQHLVIRNRAQQFIAYRENGAEVKPGAIGFADIPDEPLTAGVAFRADSVGLLYAHRVNTIFGPSESAKSWFGLACAQSVVERGGKALILDLEDSPQGWRQRAQLCGIDLAGLTYYQPVALDEQERAEVRRLAAGADLVVVDSLEELVALMRLESSNSSTSIRMAGALLRQWARASGGVLVIDHASDKTTDLSATAIGSSAKKAILDGIQLRADKITDWRPFSECSTDIMVGKDRHGGVKPHALRDPGNSDPRAFARVARLTLKPTMEGSTLAIEKPPTWEDEPADKGAVSGVQQRIFEFLALESKGGWRTKTQVWSAAGNKNGNSAIRAALAGLVADGVVEERETATKGGKSLTITEYRMVPDEDEKAGE